MKKPILSVVLALALAWPAFATAQSIFLRERIVIPVCAIDATSFEVIENQGAGGTSMWCAASIFARDYLNARGGNLTILKARGDSEAFPGRKSVIFTTAPVANSVKSTSQGVRTQGQMFSMGHANALCRSQWEILIHVRLVTP